MALLLLFAALSALCTLSFAETEAEHREHAYTIGMPVLYECEVNNNWVKPFFCINNEQYLEIPYGQDKFIYCTMEVDKEFYEVLSQLVTFGAPLQCRIWMTKDRKFYIPLALQFWGASTDTHIHVSSHLNIAAHASNGIVLGMGAYPVRDTFQLIPGPGSQYTMHGALKWHRLQGFKSFNNLAEKQATVQTTFIAIFLIFVLAICVLLFYVILSQVIIPHLRHKYVYTAMKKNT
eukprot:TRINITY_DN18079_c0_g1_i1.p1 TRINITY_DN18079_c0_g1~~TRINITY_DN18079_c0_g1_i1.p1  ORF type:complete len:234 (-),score=22.74 TRINITY_DN18079_c0_g1_i1:14-715(-)